MDKVLVSSNFTKEVTQASQFDKKDKDTDRLLGQLKIEKPASSSNQPVWYSNSSTLLNGLHTFYDSWACTIFLTSSPILDESNHLATMTNS